MSNITVISTDAKRTIVKATPGTYLSDLLQQACQKLNLNSDNYQLKHGKKTVDLSLPFRLSGLTAGAKLELVVKSKSPSVIGLTLQLPSGERIPSKFPSNFSIWQILRQYESGEVGKGRNLEITQRGYVVLTQGGGQGHLLHEMPQVTIVTRDITELEDFRKTLAQLGFNTGPVLLKLNYRKTSTPLHEAIGEIKTVFADDEESVPMGGKEAGADVISKPAAAHSKESSKQAEEEPQADQAHKDIPPSVQQPTSTSTTTKSPQTMTTVTTASVATAAPPTAAATEDSSSNPTPPSDPMDIDVPAPATTSSPAPAPPTTDTLKPTHIFAAPINSTPAAALLPYNEAAYIPTVEHAHIHQHRLLDNTQNRRLLSDAEIATKASAKASKLATVKTIDMRVRFPDNTSADWTFGPTDTGARLYEAVRSVMNPEVLSSVTGTTKKFHLALPGPGGKLIRDSASDPKKDTLIKGYELKGKVLVNMVLETDPTSTTTASTGTSATKGDVRKPAFLKPEFSSKAEQVSVPAEPADVKDDGAEAKIGGMFKSLGANMAKEAGEVGKKMPKWFKGSGKK